MNAHLLWALDRAVYGQLAEPNPWHAWTLSVNMRGAVGDSSTSCRTWSSRSPSTSPRRGNRATRETPCAPRSGGNAHWGAWYALRLLNAFGERRIRRFAAKFNARPRPVSMGTFSASAPSRSRAPDGFAACPP